jgi:hypothetical protein
MHPQNPKQKKKLEIRSLNINKAKKLKTHASIVQQDNETHKKS